MDRKNVANCKLVTVCLTMLLLARYSHGALSLKFQPPIDLGGKMSGWGDSDNVVRLDNTTVIAFTSVGALVSQDNGWTYKVNPGGALPGGVMFCPHEGVLQTLTPSIPKVRAGYNFSASSYHTIRWGSTGSLVSETINATLSYLGLPHKVTCKQGLRTDGCCGCPFRVGGHGSNNVVRLSDGSFLQTVNIFFTTHTTHQGPSSLVCYRSTDGKRWDFLSLIANATDFPDSEEGPNESALTWLADGATLMAVMRMDGGDGPPDRKHTVLYQSFSEDRGRTWSHAVPMQPPSLLSVRPKILMMDYHGPGMGPLLLTTGRPGIMLWVNWDGMGRNWSPSNIAELHNSLLPQSQQDAAFSPKVVEGKTYFSPYQSSVYNSLVPGNTSDSAIIYYNRRSIKGFEQPDAVYAMHITVAQS